jgi:hypothetical protein
MAAPRWTGASRALALAGVIGGLLYLAGDLLFYGQLGSGETFRSLPAMAQRSDVTLIAGGVVAPLASAGYALGTLAMALVIRARHPRLAAVFLASWTGMFLVGIAYHTVYTTRGFAAKLADPAAAEQTLGRIGALLSTLYAGEAALGAVGTLTLAAAVLLGESGYPRWILLLSPTAWALAGDLARVFPAPVGSVISGGWINGWFTIFFLAAFVVLARRAPDPGPDGRP